MSTASITRKDELVKDFPPKISERYACLESILRKAMQASQAHFDVETAMTEVYGTDDVASFGKETLRVFFNSGLSKIQEQVLQRMETYCREQKIPNQLLKLECLALKLELEADWEKYLDQQDHSLAKNTLEQAKLPPGYTADDVVQFQVYEQLMEQESTLGKQLAQIETEVAELERSDQTATGSFEQKREKVAQLTTEMEKAADVTSTVTK